MSSKKNILCFTILVETSPQALPLGAACIASSLKNDNEISSAYNIFLKSFSLEEKIALNQVANDLICDFDPDLVFFSTYVWNKKILLDLTLELKKIKPCITIIAGGPELTANPFSFPCADFSVSGEGELSCVCLVKNLMTEKKSFYIQGIYSKDDFKKYEALGDEEKKQMVLFSKRSQRPDCKNLSSPYLDGTLDPAFYEGALWELARGCPFKCSYCYESKGEKKIIHFPQERLLRELDFFAEKKVGQVFVLDPTYNADKKSALAMLKAIKEKTPDTFYYFEARAEFIDVELAKAFASIPCALQIGLQSADEKVLSLVNRTMNRKQFVNKISILNNCGVNFGLDLIYGLPGDTLSGFKNSIDFAISLYPNNLEVFCLSVLPGTDIFDRSEELKLNFECEPPYHVLYTDLFSKTDIALAAKLSAACSFFYTHGRAVPWFNSFCKALHIKPSVLFLQFSNFAQENKYDLCDCNIQKDFNYVQKIQLEFLEKLFEEKNMKKLFVLAKDLVLFNGAISSVIADGHEVRVNLSYHPDDLYSEYASDLNFFFVHASKCPNKTRVFMTKNGVDFSTF